MERSDWLALRDVRDVPSPPPSKRDPFSYHRPQVERQWDPLVARSNTYLGLINGGMPNVHWYVFNGINYLRWQGLLLCLRARPIGMRISVHTLRRQHLSLLSSCSDL